MRTDEFEAWLRLSASRLHDQARTLTELDQAIGDGDHGINMDRGFTAVVAMLDSRAGNGSTAPNGSTTGQELAKLFRDTGQTLIKTVGGASGPLYGMAFLKAGAVFTDRPNPQIADLVDALEVASRSVATLGNSTTGEKTMLDALVPAVAAAREALASGGASTTVVLAAARRAAEAGAKATIPMKATKGRASYLGERSIGHQDPGATSATLLVGALAESVRS